jgi:hypothetical protein
VPDTLSVHLGRSGPRSLEVPDSFEAHGRFDVELVNHGVDAHVHLQFDDPLAAVATVQGDNPYVAADSTQTVNIRVEPLDEPVEGTLTLATGYGQERATVRVRLVAPVNEAVEVDESLSKPKPREDGGGFSLPDGLSALPVALLALLALLVAVGAYVVSQQSLVVAAAAFVVVGAALGAVAYVLAG